MNEYNKLIAGYKDFRNEYVGKEFNLYRKWATKTQNPKVMLIGCSDSRVNPAIITHAGLGSIFMVNNVANIIPPDGKGEITHHSTSSAIEYAVKHLQVEDIIIMGHSGCGGIKSLFEQPDLKDDCKDEHKSFIKSWMNIVREAKTSALTDYKDRPIEEQISACERYSILISLKNLKTFSFVQESLEKKTLRLHAWYFSISDAKLFDYNEQENLFKEII